MKLVTVTYAHPTTSPKLDVVKKIMAKHGFEFHIYNHRDAWRGFGEKLLAAYEAARAKTDCSHLLFIDAFDVIVTASPDEILARFLEFQHPFVCGSEVNSWPDADRASQYPPCDTPWRFLNSGAYIAEREYLFDLLGKWGGSSISPHVDDQRFLTDIYLKESGAILLDTNCRLFQSLLGSWHLLKVENRRLFNTLTGTNPLVAHHNGGADIQDENARRLWQ